MPRLALALALLLLALLAACGPTQLGETSHNRREIPPGEVRPMTVRRRLALSAALIAAGSGCAASRVGHLTRPEPLAPMAAQNGPTVAQIVARQNQNAAQVESLAAEPVISALLAKVVAAL